MIFKKLSDIASIEISGVDKKTKDNEIPVKLCNYTDVYYNWDIDSSYSDKFMRATAKQSEIDKFSLKRNDVVITKDSETRYDIGMSCLIKEDLEDTILGYHCAIIRPYKNIDGGYLNLCLKAKIARKYFSNQASGSGQRYTLTLNGIGSVKVPIIPYEEQIKISKIFSNINKKIRVNNKINDNLQQLITTIYDYYFSQFNFPDENNNPYKDSNNNLIWNEKLKMMIPSKWEVKSIINYFNIYQPETISNKDFDDLSPFKVYGGGGLIGRFNKYNHKESEVIISCRGSCGNIYFTTPKSWITGNAMVIQPITTYISKYFIFEFLKRFGVEKYLTGSVQKQLTRENLSLMNIIVPDFETLIKYNKLVKPLFDKIIAIQEENDNLIILRNKLLPLLINGQVSID